MENKLTLSLYRRAIKLVSAVSSPHAIQLAQARWAEFLPASVVVAKGDTLQGIARRCFELPSSPARLANAFTFIKEASGSSLSIELQAMWESIASAGEYNLCECMGLMSAALELAGGAGASLSLRTSADHYSHCMQTFVQRIVTEVRGETGECHAKTVVDVDALVEAIRRASSIKRKDTGAEDYTLLSFVHHQCASEYVLNIVLLMVLREMGISGSLVGTDLIYRWVRVELPTGPAFASWSVGCKKKKDIQGMIRTADKQWFRTVGWGPEQRKSVAISLLKKQLACLSSGSAGPSPARQQSICKEQVIYLLT